MEALALCTNFLAGTFSGRGEGVWIKALRFGDADWHASGDKKGMNTPNAYGFFGVGLVMQGLHFLPGISAVRELWLMVMGSVLILVGGGFLAQVAWSWITPRLITPLIEALPRRQDVRQRAPAGQRVTS